MNKLAVIYHSAHGHTEHIAKHVVAGAATVDNTEARLLKAEDLARAPGKLLEFDGYIFGSPTYLGGVSGPFKTFMDATGRLWRTQQLKGRLAAGFTVSSLPAGDKQSTLGAMFTFSMQHGMLWSAIHPARATRGCCVRGSGQSPGLMVGPHGAGRALGTCGFLCARRHKTARMFGRNFAKSLERLGQLRLLPEQSNPKDENDSQEIRSLPFWPHSFRRDVAGGFRHLHGARRWTEPRLCRRLEWRVAHGVAHRFSGGAGGGALRATPGRAACTSASSMRYMPVGRTW